MYDKSMDMQDRAFYEGIDQLNAAGVIDFSVHKPSGEHFLTNLPAQRRPIVKQAIEETGSPVYVEDVATDIQDRVIPGWISVMAGYGDLGAFWDAYARLLAEFEGGKR